MVNTNRGSKKVLVRILLYGRKKIILVVFITIIALSWLAIELFIYDRIDRCLDSGGAFDNGADICVYK